MVAASFCVLTTGNLSRRPGYGVARQRHREVVQASAGGEGQGPRGHGRQSTTGRVGRAPGRQVRPTDLRYGATTASAGAPRKATESGCRPCSFYLTCGVAPWYKILYPVQHQGTRFVDSLERRCATRIVRRGSFRWGCWLPAEGTRLGARRRTVKTHLTAPVNLLDVSVLVAGRRSSSRPASGRTAVVEGRE